MKVFRLGDKVKVNHPTAGMWKGEITMINDTGLGMEYEVSNSPYDRGPNEPAGWRWHPLVWETELVSLHENA